MKSKGQTGTTTANLSSREIWTTRNEVDELQYEHVCKANTAGSSRCHMQTERKTTHLLCEAEKSLRSRFAAFASPLASPSSAVGAGLHRSNGKVSCEEIRIVHLWERIVLWHRLCAVAFSPRPPQYLLGGIHRKKKKISSKWDV